uniref:Uncharacterized protein n=1 Tax=Ditylenchus dipsaci TaxID=166011 RepID=A0A915ERD0_9BILA
MQVAQDVLSALTANIKIGKTDPVLFGWTTAAKCVRAQVSNFHNTQYISAVVIPQVGDGLLNYRQNDAEERISLRSDDIKNGEYLTMISEDLNQRMIPTTTVNLL